MLAPDSRAVAMEVLRPPAGYQLEHAVLTTYSLDLEVLLALPLAVMALADGGIEDLLQDPLLLLQAMREAGKRVHVFVDETGIAVPGTKRTLYGALEESVHPVRMPGYGALHAKGWFVRFISEDNRSLLRVAVASRNLTFDRCWDIALVSETEPAGNRKVRASRALADLLGILPSLAVLPLDESLTSALEEMADEIERCAFPAPEGFDEPVWFHALGLKKPARKLWRPWQSGRELLAVSPFVSRSALAAMAETADHSRLISRREELDKLPDEALEAWDEVLVLSDAAIDEPEDGVVNRPSGLHVKLFAMEQAREASWLAGSANLTAAAFTGQNIELMAELRGPRRKYGVQPFLDAGFLNLCEPYRRRGMIQEDKAAEQGRRLLEAARTAMTESGLRVLCRPGSDGYYLEIEGRIDLPDGVEVRIWPVSLDEELARRLELPAGWHLPMTRLTAFIAFRLKVEAEVDDLCFVLKLPAEGLPEGRIAQVLRTLIDSPERFLQFLRALLGGIEGIIGLADGTGTWQGASWKGGMGGETLLEDLVRVASRDPQRLVPVRKLIEELRSNPEGREIVPDEFYAIWQVIDLAVNGLEN